MATPIVSGAVALVLQQNPSMTPDQVKARLMKTAWKGVGQYIFSHDFWGTFTTTSTICLLMERGIWISTPRSATRTSQRDGAFADGGRKL